MHQGRGEAAGGQPGQGERDVVPEHVRVPHRGVARQLALLEAPLGQRLGGAGQHALDEVVVELELGGDGVDHLALLPAHDLQPPVGSVPGPVLAIARRLEVELINFDHKTISQDLQFLRKSIQMFNVHAYTCVSIDPCIEV